MTNILLPAPIPEEIETVDPIAAELERESADALPAEPPPKEYDEHGNPVTAVAREPLSILTFDEIEQVPLDTNDRILGDHLLDRGSPLVIAGQGGTGKSRLIFQFLAATKRGDEKFLNFDIHPGARDMRWLVLQTENSVRRLKRERERLKTWLPPECWEKFNSEVFILAPLKEEDSMVNLDDPENINRIKAALEKFKPDGVIADPLGDYSTGDLNKDVDMRSTIITLSRLSKHQNPNRALVVLHHALTGQAGAAKATGYDRASFARNSKVLFGWTRAQINVAPMSEETNEELSISCGKCSDGKEFLPFGIRLNTNTLIYEMDENLDVVSWGQKIRGGDTTPKYDSNRVLQLCQPAMRKPDLAKAVMDDIGCSRVSAYRYITKALQEKTIKENNGRMFKN